MTLKERFRPGSRVILHGLRANALFNNRRGKVLKKLESAHGLAAYEICLTDGQLVKALDANLDPAPVVAEESGSDESDQAHPDADRAKLEEELFHLLDQSGEGMLRSEALHHLAVACGFQQGLVKWEDEYQALCKLCGTSPDAGFQQMDFVKLLSNEALPTYCATEELAHLVPNIQQLINAHKEQKEQAPGPREGRRFKERSDAVKFIFKSMDTDSDGFLSGSEMCRFAELCGFDDEWQVEYEVMCEHMAINKDRGADFDDFYRLVSDRKSHVFCTREELRSIASQIQERRASISEKQAAIRIQALARGNLVRHQLQRQVSTEHAIPAGLNGRLGRSAPKHVPHAQQKHRGSVEAPDPPPAPPESESEDSSSP
ncbi:unnamed protein product [Symbiodinium natans]|uniref:EF-hand domain-containing protein n=1 Tax=Symbiodinium natans TaxID=878477 RepID=A0A812J685_9DINO|nr:unnamed protein product [Symbiodinium natans]